MSESIHGRLERTRKPRVHIKYKVHTGDAEVDKEIPFVVGVVGDFSGDPTAKLKPLEERKFIDIDRDNFNEVMKRMTPGLSYRVENTLKDNNTEMQVKLKFESMDDFHPAKVIQQVDPLKKLMETRQKLEELMNKADRSQDLEQLLTEVLDNTSEENEQKRDELARDLQETASKSSTDQPSGDESQ